MIEWSYIKAKVDNSNEIIHARFRSDMKSSKYVEHREKLVDDQWVSISKDEFYDEINSYQRVMGNEEIINLEWSDFFGNEIDKRDVSKI